MPDHGSGIVQTDFQFPKRYTSFPPFFTLQPTLSTRHAQFQHWSALILSYCRHYHLYRLTLVDALNTPLFHNTKLRKRLTMQEAREVLEWMASEEGGKRVEWIGREGERGSCWIYWRRPEEWAELLASWVITAGDVHGKAETDTEFRSKRRGKRTRY